MITCRKKTKVKPEPLPALCSLFMVRLRKAPGVRAQGPPLSAGISPVSAPWKPVDSGGELSAPHNFLMENRDEI